MGNYNLFLVVLTFTTLSGVVIVFLLERMIRYDERWLDKFKDVLVNPNVLGQIFKLPNEEPKSRKKEYTKRLDKEMEKYIEECELTLDDFNCKVFISPSAWDNFVDVLTVDIKRAKRMLERYIDGFKEVFGTSSYSGKFYNEILGRMKYKSYKSLKIIVIIFLSFLIASISCVCVITCIDLCILKNSNCDINCYELKYILIITVSSLCIFLQFILIMITCCFSKPTKNKRSCKK